MATNLSANAKPWEPNGPAPQQQQQQHGGGGHHRGGYYNNNNSRNGQMIGGGNGIRQRGSQHINSSMGMGGHVPPHHLHKHHDDYSTGISGGGGAIQNNNSNNHHSQQPKFSPTAAKLFVGQLPFECTEERLRNLFSAYGNVEHIHILRDNSNRSRGAAFVTYTTVQEADTAIFTLHNRYRMLTNRAIQVSYAKNSPNISPFGTYSAVEVHQSNPTNPLPDVATAAS